MVLLKFYSVYGDEDEGREKGVGKDEEGGDEGEGREGKMRREEMRVRGGRER